MISSELLKILRCPETHQSLSFLETARLKDLNGKISAGKLLNRAGIRVTESIDGGLVREDGKVFYPMRGEIPVLLINEAIQL